jgi:GNAT superfamily N-acetyltransferase
MKNSASICFPIDRQISPAGAARPPLEGPVRLRRARMDDLPVLTQMIRQAVCELNAADFSLEQIESALRHGYGSDNPRLILECTYYVAEIGDEIVGSGGWSRLKAVSPSEEADEADLIDPAQEPAKIRAFFVHPAYARRGIATRLLRASEKSARQAGFRQLELLATRTGEPVYTRFGFELVERLDLTLPDGIVFPVARMVKNIA